MRFVFFAFVDLLRDLDEPRRAIERLDGVRPRSAAEARRSVEVELT